MSKASHLLALSIFLVNRKKLEFTFAHAKKTTNDPVFLLLTKKTITSQMQFEIMSITEALN